MTPKEYEKWLTSLNDNEYDILIQERIARLEGESLQIAQAREDRRKERRKLYHKLNDPDPEVRRAVMKQIMDGEGHECEHGRSWVKHCLACGEMDHIMFPELFDKDGFPIEE